MNDDFYVGYFPNAPPALAKVVVRIAVGLLVIGCVAGALILFAQSPFAASKFEYGQYRDYIGVLEEWPYPMGHISFVGKLDGVTLSAGAPPLTPGFTLDLMAKHSLDFWLTSEDLPDPENRVTLDREGKIVLAYTPNNLEGHERLHKVLKQILSRGKCAIHGSDWTNASRQTVIVCPPGSSSKRISMPAAWHAAWTSRCCGR